MDDRTLLRQYVVDGSTDALDELVRRHTPMVYSAALRRVGDAHRAEDITQAVFLLLIRKAGRISRRVVLGGWLFNVTRFAAARENRGHWRRQYHERQAARMNPIAAAPNSAETLEALSPLLNEAIASLSRDDRDAVVMKYLQGKSCRQVADAQQVSEAAASKRLSRATRKLRAWFERKNILVPDDALGAALAMAGSGQVPADLAVRIIAAMHGSTVGSSVAIANVTQKLIAMAKLKLIAAAGIAITLAGAAGGVIAYRVYAAQPVATVQMDPSPPPQIQPYPLVFSSDGTHIAYAARQGAQWVAIVDGKQGAEYDNIDRKSVV